jgi:hypothetical protein
VKPRLGWLGPVLVLAGAAVAALGVWWMVHARPRAGRILDVIPLDDDAAFVVRAQEDSDRAFLELQTATGELRWQALIPPYAGRPGAPGLAWNSIAVSVRVIRDGRPEVFAMSIRDSTKLGGYRLAADRPASPTGYTLPAAVTLGDREREFELVGDDTWHDLVAVDLATGKGLWRVELGAEPIDRAGVDGGVVWVAHGAATRGFAATTGAAMAAPLPVPPIDRRDLPQPVDALPRQPYHLTARTLWLAFPDHVEARPLR